MNSHSVLSNCAHVNRNKSYPHGKKYQHAEGYKLGFIEIVRQFPGQKGHCEAHASQETDVSKNAPEADF